MQMSRVAFSLVGAVLAFAGYGYDWSGKTGVVTLTESVTVAESDMPTVAALTGIQLQGEAVELIFLNTSSAVLGCWINGEGRIVKRGSGDLRFGTPNAKTVVKPCSSGYELNADYFTAGGILVETGHLWAPNGGGQPCWYGPITVNAGATFHLSADVNSGCEGLFGAGTVRAEYAAVWGDDYQSKFFSIGYEGSAVQSVFSGNFSGGVRLSVAANCDLTGVSSQAGVFLGVYRKSFRHDAGTVGIMKFGPRPPITGGWGYKSLDDPAFADYTSSLGMGNSYYYGVDIELDYTGRILCLGETDETTGKLIRFGSTYTTGDPNEIDAGHHGGVTFAGAWSHRAGGQTRMNGSLLSGTNVSDMVIAGPVETGGGVLHFKKRGSGAWRLSSSAADMAECLGAWFVEEGTLKYDSIADVGAGSSMGMASACYPFSYTADIAQHMVPENRLGCEVALGDPYGVAMPSLEYTGSAAASSNRRIGLLGRGGSLVNDSEAALVLTGGIYPMTVAAVTTDTEGKIDTEEKTLRLESAHSGNVVSGIVENAAGRLNLVKAGAGDWTVRGNLALTGDIAVEAGRLVLAPCGTRPYDWFRFTVTELHRANDSGYGDTLWLSKLWLFDEDGVWINRNLEFVRNPAVDVAELHSSAETYDWRALQPGQLTMGEFVAPLQFGSGTTPANIMSDENTFLRSASNNGCREGNDVKWPFVFRLSAGTKPARYFDFVSRFGWDEPETDHPAFYTLEGSADGVNWTMLHSTRDCEHPKGGSWASTGVAYEPGENQNCRSVGKEFGHEIATGLENRETVNLSVARSVKVFAGATLETSAIIELPKLTVDARANSDAVVKGFVFSTSGVLTIENLSGSQEKTLPVSLLDCTGVENISNWSLVVNGRSTTRKSVEVRNGRLVIVSQGFSVIIR